MLPAPEPRDDLETGVAAWREAVAGLPRRGTPAAAPIPLPVELAIVVPCFNEAAVLPETVERLARLLRATTVEGLTKATSTVWFVDDGSSDASWALIEEAARVFPWAHGIKLSRNHGHQNALLAGLLSVEADAVVTVDADLQDDLDAVRLMLLEHGRGAEVVYGVRRTRSSDSWFKRTTAEAYYRLLARLGVDVVFNHADYRLLGRRPVAALREFGEANLFLRGIIPKLGFPVAHVPYDRAARFDGESKYPLRKMLAFALDGITSFSAVPLRWITAAGFAISGLAFGTGIWAIAVRVAGMGAVPGWTSTVVPVAFLGGIQLISLGVIGEYVGRVYGEAKRRPRFIVEKTV